MCAFRHSNKSQSQSISTTNRSSQIELLSHSTTKNQTKNAKQTEQFKFPSIPRPKEPKRLILTDGSSSLTEIISNLPSYGTISYDASTCYWHIKLPTEWQNARELIVNCIRETYDETAWYRESKELGKCWWDLVDVVNPKLNHKLKLININSVTPPSVVGLHISLGVWDITATDCPTVLIPHKRVEFKIGDIISFRSIRPTPQNIPGQYTNCENLRYYPTRWIFNEITFVDFEFPTRYPPHISIACIAVQLNVNHVAQFQKEYVTSTTENIEGIQQPILINITSKESTSREETKNDTSFASSIQDQYDVTPYINNHCDRKHYKLTQFIGLCCLFILIAIVLLFPFPLIDVFICTSSPSSTTTNHHHLVEPFNKLLF